jgi:hypothetical protein
MNKTRLTLLSLLLAIAVSSVFSAFGVAADTTDHTTPSYDMKGQSLADLQVVQKKFVDLANALPAGKFN